jgi:hypothetical protein
MYAEEEVVTLAGFESHEPVDSVPKIAYLLLFNGQI